VIYLKGHEMPDPVAGETYNVNAVGVMATATLGQGLVDLAAGTDLEL
jgi:hypothetical protein